MKTVKQLTALMIALLLLFTAAQAEWKPAEGNNARFLELIDLLDASVENGGKPDMDAAEAVLEAIRQENADDYDIARAILDHWNATVADRNWRMFAYRGEDKAYALERSGLDFSGKHAFVVLGFQLEDGEMQEELIGRCDAAAAAARSFPDSILITTGGATGPNNPNMHTEAEMMRNYLMKTHMVSPYRIFTETEAMTTLENAVNTFRFLQEQGIETFTIITSNYHQRWSQILFNAMAAIYEKETGYKVRIVGNFNYLARPNVTATTSVRIALSQLGTLFGRSMRMGLPPAEGEEKK